MRMVNNVIKKSFNRLLELSLMLSLSNCLELSKINATVLPLWYDVLAICMLNRPDLGYPKALEFCWKQIPGKGFYSLPTEGQLSQDFSGHCCTLDMPLADRGFDLGLILVL